MREQFLQEYPLCYHCLENGRTAAANEVHHLIPRRHAKHLEMKWGNLMALCKPCHDKESRREQAAARA